IRQEARAEQGKREISWFFGAARGSERGGESHGGSAQVDRLRDVEVEGGASRNSDEIRVLVQLLEKPLGIDLSTGLQAGGESVFNSSAVDLRCATQRREEGSRLRKRICPCGNHGGKDRLGLGVFVGFHGKPA